MLHTDKTNSRIPIRSNQNKHKDNIDKYYKTMTKLIDSILTRRLSHDLVEIIYEYARDDSKKKEFIRMYPNLHYIWISFVNMNRNSKRKYIKVFPKSKPNGSLYVRLGRRDENDECDEFMEINMVYFVHIDTNIVYDQNFLVSSIVPNHFINGL